MMTRRQNRCCDQCRRAKRACDAPVLADLGYGSDGSDGSAPDLFLRSFPHSFTHSLAQRCPADKLPGDKQSVDPCSYCLKTQKECTLNWVRSQTNYNDNARRSKRRRTVPEASRETPSSLDVRRNGNDLSTGTDALPVSSAATNTAATHTASSVVSNSDAVPVFFPSPTVQTASAEVVSLFEEDNSFLLHSDLTLPGLPHLHALAALPPPEPHPLTTTTTTVVTTAAAIPAEIPFRIPPPSTTEVDTFGHPRTLYNLGNVSNHDQHHDQDRWSGQNYTYGHEYDYSQEHSTTYATSQASSNRRHDHGTRSNSTNSSSIRRPSDIFSVAPVSVASAPIPVPSLFDYTIMTQTNNSLICDSLMRVYHDVLENALSCWLTEETCPYKMLPRSKGQIAGSAPIPAASSDNASFDSEPMQREWSTAWSNRIYRRVIQLDRVARSTNVIYLSREEDIAASRALHLSIMAFATQWAQGSRRSREGFIAPGGSGAEGIAELEFDRTIQWSLWTQARGALQDCAELESFRVAIAELIFGLTQKPLEDIDLVDYFSSGSSSPDKTIRRCVGNLLSRDGPPMFHERASRKIHAMKARFEMRESGFTQHLLKGGRRHIPNYQQQQKHQSTEQQCLPEITLSGEDRRTIGLMYWLALMFDTVSSAMNERPLAVSDSECQEEPLAARTRTIGNGGSVSTITSEPVLRSNNSLGSATDVPISSSTSLSGSSSSSLPIIEYGRYWSDLFVKDNSSIRPPTQTLRWPCSYDDAARFLTKAAPVKVLLFRHVTYLQRFVTRSSSSSSFSVLSDSNTATDGEIIERQIQEALAIYRHWSVTYAPFFRDLIDKYDTVPPRIQSWFVCLLGHWHLAGLMLADLIEFIDDTELGLSHAGRNRQVSNLISRLRKSNSHGLADIGRVASPSSTVDDLAQDISPELTQSQLQCEHLLHEHQTPASPLDPYHSAVNEGSILTEPWTMILIRAFSKASIILLEEAEGFPRDGDDGLGHMDGEYLKLIQSCDNCIRALRCLGKKSDMAGSVAVVLTQARMDLVASHSQKHHTGNEIHNEAKPTSARLSDMPVMSDELLPLQVETSQFGQLSPF